MPLYSVNKRIELDRKIRLFAEDNLITALLIMPVFGAAVSLDLQFSD